MADLVRYQGRFLLLYRTRAQVQFLSGVGRVQELVVELGLVAELVAELADLVSHPVANTEVGVGFYSLVLVQIVIE